MNTLLFDEYVTNISYTRRAIYFKLTLPMKWSAKTFNIYKNNIWKTRYNT